MKLELISIVYLFIYLFFGCDCRRSAGRGRSDAAFLARGPLHARDHRGPPAPAPEPAATAQGTPFFFYRVLPSIHRVLPTFTTTISFNGLYLIFKSFIAFYLFL